MSPVNCAFVDRVSLCPCVAYAMPGSTFCVVHSNQDPVERVKRKKVGKVVPVLCVRCWTAIKPGTLMRKTQLGPVHCEFVCEVRDGDHK